LLELLYDYDKQNGWVEKLLLVTPVRKIRRGAANAILRLSQQTKDDVLEKLGVESPTKRFLASLLSILPGITAYAGTCQQVPPSVLRASIVRPLT